MSHIEITFYKDTSICLVTQQQGNRKKYKETLSATEGWLNHELTLPREHHHHFFMRCQPQWGKPRCSRCAPVFLLTIFPSQRGVPLICFPSQPVLFVWFGPLPDQSGRRHNRRPAGEVAPQHGLHAFPICPPWRISQRTTDQTGSHMFVTSLSFQCFSTNSESFLIN